MFRYKANAIFLQNPMGQKENINQRKVVGLIDQMKVPTRGRDLKMVIRSLAKPLLIVPEGSLSVVSNHTHVCIIDS